MTRPAVSPPALAGPGLTALGASARLARLHLASRRLPTSLLALVTVAAVLRITLIWTPAGGAYAATFPLTLATAAASVVGLTTYSPIGEPERVTGRWLPVLRLGTILATGGAACGALALGAVGGRMALGVAALLRDLAGLTGLALLTAAVLGAVLSWIGPLAYMVLSGYAIQEAWTTPWLWPARPAGDLGAAICAALVLAVGVAAASLRGPRD